MAKYVTAAKTEIKLINKPTPEELLKEELLKQELLKDLMPKPPIKDITEPGNFVENLKLPSGFETYPPDLVRKHQTAVIVPVLHPSVATPYYWERIERFIYSFNHEQTIKADILMLMGKTIVAKKYFKSINLSAMFEKLPKLGTTIKVPIKELEQWTKDREYNLFVLATPPGFQDNLGV